MIEIKCMLHNQPMTILVDSRAIHSYVDMRFVEKFKLERIMHKKAIRVKCLGLNKYLVVSLTQIPNRSLFMDIVVMHD